jgi:hypothetical protein
MNKVLLGLLLGAILGAIDGMTAWFTPEARAEIAGIVIGSPIKGIVAGILIGVFRSQGAFAGAGHCVRSRRRTAPGIHRRPDATRLLLPDHAAWRHGGPHRGLRDTAVRAWAKTPTDIGQRLQGARQEGTIRDFSDS